LRQIETHYPALVGLAERSPESRDEFLRQLVVVTRHYLWTASLTSNAQPAELSASLIDRALKAAADYRAALDAINAAGDAGDHINALHEKHFSHYLIAKGSDEGALAILASIASASEWALARTLAELNSAADTGFKVNHVWEAWIRRLTDICQTHELPTSASKGDDKRSDDRHSAFVWLVHDLQQGFDKRYRRGDHSLSALANAIYRARRGSGTKDPSSE
jgi:hypothetical protein